MSRSRETLASPARDPRGGAGNQKGSTRKFEGGQKSDDGRRVIYLPRWTVNPRYGLYVHGFVRGTECRFLIDSGSTETLIDSEVYYNIPTEKRPVLEPDSVQVTQVDGSPLSVLGVADVEINVGRTTQLVRAVFTSIRSSGILGMDFLMATGGKLDFGSQKLTMSGEEIRCTGLAGTPFVGKVVVLENTVIPAGHEAVNPGIVIRKTGELVGTGNS